VSYIIKNPGIVWDLLLEHLQMTSLALLIAVLVALLSLITRYRWLSVPVLGTLRTLYGAEPSVDYSAGAFNSNSVVVGMAIYAQVILVRITVGLIDQPSDSGSSTRHGHESLATLVVLQVP